MKAVDKERITALLAGLKEKKSRLLVLLGIAGMVLILLSSLIPEKRERATEPAASPAQQSAAAYAEALEQQLASFISSIDGAGETRVMVMLENNGESRYLKADTTDRADGGASRDSRTEEYVLVDGGDGREAVMVSVSEPEIRGVAVICRGGDKAAVQARILETVTTLLDISSARVSISRMADGG